jgi:O-phosphoseryl-tRNA(Cys) synthetase
MERKEKNNELPWKNSSEMVKRKQRNEKKRSEMEAGVMRRVMRDIYMGRWWVYLGSGFRVIFIIIIPTHSLHHFTTSHTRFYFYFNMGQPHIIKKKKVHRTPPLQIRYQRKPLIPLYQ